MATIFTLKDGILTDTSIYGQSLSTAEVINNTTGVWLGTGDAYSPTFICDGTAISAVAIHLSARAADPTSSILTLKLSSNASIITETYPVSNFISDYSVNSFGISQNWQILKLTTPLTIPNLSSAKISLATSQTNTLAVMCSSANNNYNKAIIASYKNSITNFIGLTTNCPLLTGGTGILSASTTEYPFADKSYTGSYYASGGAYPYMSGTGPYQLDLNTTNFMLEVWIKPTEDVDFGIASYSNSGSSYQSGVGYTASTKTIYLYYSSTTNATKYIVTNGFILNKWNHLVIARDSSNLPFVVINGRRYRDSTYSTGTQSYINAVNGLSISLQNTSYPLKSMNGFIGYWTGYRATKDYTAYNYNIPLYPIPSTAPLSYFTPYTLRNSVHITGSPYLTFTALSVVYDPILNIHIGNSLISNSIETRTITADSIYASNIFIHNSATLVYPFNKPVVTTFFSTTGLSVARYGGIEINSGGTLNIGTPTNNVLSSVNHNILLYNSLINVNPSGDLNVYGYGKQISTYLSNDVPATASVNFNIVNSLCNNWLFSDELLFTSNTTSKISNDILLLSGFNSSNSFGTGQNSTYSHLGVSSLSVVPHIYNSTRNVKFTVLTGAINLGNNSNIYNTEFDLTSSTIGFNNNTILTGSVIRNFTDSFGDADIIPYVLGDASLGPDITPRGTFSNATTFSNSFGGFSNNKYTFESWVKPVSAFQGLLSYHPLIDTMNNQSANGRMSFGINSDATSNSIYHAFITITNSSGSVLTYNTTTSAAIGTWSHIAACIDSTTSTSWTIQLFLNGVKTEFTGQNLSNNTNFYAGGGIYILDANGLYFGRNMAKISVANYRIVRDANLYTNNFIPNFLSYNDFLNPVSGYNIFALDPYTLQDVSSTKNPITWNVNPFVGYTTVLPTTTINIQNNNVISNNIFNTSPMTIASVNYDNTIISNNVVFAPPNVGININNLSGTSNVNIINNIVLGSNNNYGVLLYNNYSGNYGGLSYNSNVQGMVISGFNTGNINGGAVYSTREGIYALPTTNLNFGNLNLSNNTLVDLKISGVSAISVTFNPYLTATRSASGIEAYNITGNLSSIYLVNGIKVAPASGSVLNITNLQSLCSRTSGLIIDASNSDIGSINVYNTNVSYNTAYGVQLSGNANFYGLTSLGNLGNSFSAVNTSGTLSSLLINNGFRAIVSGGPLLINGLYSLSSNKDGVYIDSTNSNLSSSLFTNITASNSNLVGFKVLGHKTAVNLNVNGLLAINCLSGFEANNIYGNLSSLVINNGFRTILSGGRLNITNLSSVSSNKEGIYIDASSTTVSAYPLNLTNINASNNLSAAFRLVGNTYPITLNINGLTGSNSNLSGFDATNITGNLSSLMFDYGLKTSVSAGPLTIDGFNSIVSNRDGILIDLTTASLSYNPLTFKNISTSNNIGNGVRIIGNNTNYNPLSLTVNGLTSNNNFGIGLEAYNIGGNLNSMSFNNNAVNSLKTSIANLPTIIDGISGTINTAMSAGVLTKVGTSLSLTSPYDPRGWSAYFTANNSSYFSTGFDTSMGTNPFTIEFWVYPMGSLTTCVFSDFHHYFSADSGYIVYWDAANKRITWMVNTTVNSVPANTWTHVAYCRDSSNLIRVYTNGVLNASATYASAVNGSSDRLIFGSFFTDGVQYLPYNGYISNFRLIKNQALYTSNTSITLPTSALPNVAGTSYLIFQDSTFIDNVTKQKSFTNVGPVSVVNFSPFTPTVPYSQNVFDGAISFTGSTSDYLYTVPIFDLSLNNFTMEGWFYPTIVNTNPYLFGFEVDASNRLEIYRSTNLRLYTNVAGSATDRDTGITDNMYMYRWNHIALVKNGANSTLYLNGVSAYTAAVTYPAGLAKLVIGTYSGSVLASNMYSGLIGDVRVTKGTPLYTTSPYTPDTYPFNYIINSNNTTVFLLKTANYLLNNFYLTSPILNTAFINVISASNYNQFVIKNASISATSLNTDLSASIGINISNIGKLEEFRLEGCGLSAGTPLQLSTTRSKLEGSYIFHNSNSNIYGLSSLALTGYQTDGYKEGIIVMAENGLSGNHYKYTGAGSITFDTVEVNAPNTVSERLTPWSATTKLRSTSKLIPIGIGESFTVQVTLKGSTNYTGAAPRLMMVGNPSMGYDDQVLATGNLPNGSWETMSFSSLIAAANNGVVEFYVDCSGNIGSGYINIDSWNFY